MAKISKNKNNTISLNQKQKTPPQIKNNPPKDTKKLLDTEKKRFESARTVRQKNIALASGDNLSPKDREVLINEAQPYILLALANRNDLSPKDKDELINKGDNHVFKALEKNHTLTPEQIEKIRIKGRIEI